MISAGAKEDSRKVEGLQRPDTKTQVARLDEQLHKWITEEQNVGRKAEGEGQKPDAETLARFSRELPLLIQKALTKLDATQVYQSFQLPGKEILIHDNRGGKTGKEAPHAEDEAGKKIAKESKAPLEDLLLKEGRLLRVKEKGYENYLGEPQMKGLQEMEKAAAGRRLLELLSRFEKTLLKRFEKGEETAVPAEAGKFSFLKKTGAQWRRFFAHFVKRTVKKEMTREQVAEMVHRGFVRKPDKATLISDLALANGLLEKFVRLRLNPQNAQVAQFFQNLPPGVRLSPEDLKRFLAERFDILTIRAGEESQAFTKAPQKGKFLESAQAEMRLAGDLGVQLGEQLKEKVKMIRSAAGSEKGGRGFGGFGGGEEGEGQEQRERFIPWWQYGPFRKKGRAVRWFVMSVLLLLISAIVLTVIYSF